MKTFYNTNGLSDDEIKIIKEKFLNQERAIYEIFKVKKELTAGEVYKIYEEQIKSIPITSVRRAITNLTKRGYLRKLNKTKKGLYGMPEHVYQLINKYELF